MTWAAASPNSRPAPPFQDVNRLVVIRFIQLVPCIPQSPYCFLFSLVIQCRLIQAVVKCHSLSQKYGSGPQRSPATLRASPNFRKVQGVCSQTAVTVPQKPVARSRSPAASLPPPADSRSEKLPPVSAAAIHSTVVRRNSSNRPPRPKAARVMSTAGKPVPEESRQLPAGSGKTQKPARRGTHNCPEKQPPFSLPHRFTKNQSGKKQQIEIRSQVHQKNRSRYSVSVITPVCPPAVMSVHNHSHSSCPSL